MIKRKMLPGRFGYVYLLFAIPLLNGCGSRQLRVLDSPADYRDGSSNVPAKDATFRPTKKYAKVYESPGEPQRTIDPFHGPTLKIVEEVSSILQRPPPQLDARLSRAAFDWANHSDMAGASYQVVEFGLQHYGIVEPSPALVFVQGGSPETLAESLRGTIEERLGAGKYSRIGIASSSHSRPSERVTVLAFQKVPLELLPLVKVQDAGESFSLRGRIGDEYFAPHVLVTDTEGRVTENAVQLSSKNAFSTKVRCGKAGKIQVEVAANSQSGPSVLANFPVYCGKAPPKKFTLRKQIQPDGTPLERAFILVNRARIKANLPPLILDAELSRVAQKYSEEMHETGVVAHVSTRSGSPADRVENAGIVAAVVLENIARSSSIAEAHEGLMNSPGHRLNILSKDVSRIGIGIKRFSDTGQEGQSRGLFFTQLFIERAKTVDPRKLLGKVQRVLERNTRLLRNANLESAAQVAAKAFAETGNLDQASDLAKEFLSQRRTGFSRMTTVVTKMLGDDYRVPSESKNGVHSHYGAAVAKVPDQLEVVIFVLLAS